MGLPSLSPSLTRTFGLLRFRSRLIAEFFVALRDVIKFEVSCNNYGVYSLIWFNDVAERMTVFDLSLDLMAWV